MKYFLLVLNILLITTPLIASEVKDLRKGGSLFIYSTDNVEMIITDPKGRQTGKNPFNKEVLNQIPESHYSIEYGYGESMPNKNHFQKMKVEEFGEYKITLLSEKGGKYNVEIRSFAADGSALEAVDKKGSIKPKEKIEIKFLFSDKSKKKSN